MKNKSIVVDTLKSQKIKIPSKCEKSTCQINDLLLTTEHYAERISYLEKLIRKYKFDMLTGLMGKRDFNEKFERVFEEYKFADKRFTLTILDIDGLHNVNRKDGYMIGDKLIQKVGETLLELFDFHQVYRISGDEFAIIVREKIYNKDAIETKLKKIDKTTSHTELSVDFISPAEMFKFVDKQLSLKKRKINRI